jgi:hypothetical protein
MSFQQGNRLDLDEIGALDERDILHPLQVMTRANRPYNGAEYGFNAEGYMSSCSFGQAESIYTYTQFFRDGVIEFYTTEFIVAREDNPALNGDYVFGAAMARSVCQAVQKATRFWKHFKVDPEFLLLLSFRVPFHFGYLAGINNVHEGPFQKNLIDLPAIAFSGLDLTNAQIYDAFRPNLDILWQIAGKAKSPSKEQFFHPSSLI